MAQVRNPAAVPSVGIAADPGVRASPAAFGAATGQALQGLADEFSNIAKTAADLQERKRGINDATLLNEADINLDNSYFDLQTELDDAAPEDSFTQFSDRSTGLGDAAVKAAQEKHGVTLSKAGAEKWAIRSAQMRNQYGRRRSISDHNRQIQSDEKTAREQFDDLRSFVFQNPGAEEEARSKALVLRENLRESGIGDFHIDNWIGTEEQVAERLKKVRIMAQTDPNSDNFNPSEAMDQMTPKSELGTISKVGDWLGHAESGGRAQTNRLGYAGIHQMGAPRMSELGLYIPGAKENLKSWSKTAYKELVDTPAGKKWRIIPDTGKWSGTIKVPGFGAMTVDQFMQDPAAQLEAWRIHERDIVSFVRSNGLDRFIGQTVHGVKITMNGMIAGAHIGGKGGMRNFILSGKNEKDENGTAISTYMKRAANVPDGETDPVFAGMSPEDQAVLMQRGNAAVATQQKGDQQAIMAQRSELDTTWESSVSSAQNTGQAVDWDEVSAAAVYGWEKVNEQKRKEARGLQRYAAAAPLETMSRRDQEQYVLDLESSARAATGSSGHADAEDVAKYARRTMTDIQRTRDIAPARAALRDPAVLEAFKEFMSDKKNPAKAIPYIKRSLRVQQGYDLDEPSTKQGTDELLKATRGNIQHLPDLLLKDIADDFEDLPIPVSREDKAELQEHLRQKYNELKGTYEEFTDEVILEAYQYMDRNEATDEVVIRAVRNIVKSGGAPRATTSVEKQEETVRLKWLMDMVSGDAFDPARPNKKVFGVDLGEQLGLVPEGDEPEIDEPSDAPIDAPKSRSELMTLAKEYARRSDDDEWLESQGLSEAQLKFIRSF